MPNAQRGHGIVNGHWEPSPPEPPKVVILVRTGVAKLLQKISPHADETGSHDKRAPEQTQPPVAAE